MRRTLLLLTIVFIPALSAQWIPLGSGLSTVRSMTAKDGAIFAVSFPSGIFKSTNGGSTWNPSNNGIAVNNGNHFAEGLGHSTTHLFAGTHTGIYRSTDGGANWALANGTLVASPSIFANKFFWLDNVMFAVFNGTIANGGGCFRSENNGNTWNIGHSGMGSNVQVNHLSKVDNTIYACTNVGIYTSTDVGLSWTILPGVNYATYGLVKAGNNLVINSLFGLRYSTNNGASWVDGANTPTNLSKGELALFEGNIHAIVPNSTAMYRTTDNGLSWSPFNMGIPPLDLALLEEFLITGNRLHASSFSDIYYLQGTGTDVVDSPEPDMARIRPTMMEDGTWLDLPGTWRNSALVLYDTQGRAVMRRDGLGGGTHYIARGELRSGTYRCVVIDLENGLARTIGTVVAP